METLHSLLSQHPTISTNLIRGIGFHGVSRPLRATVWQIALRVLSESRDEWEGAQGVADGEYAEFVTLLTSPPSFPPVEGTHPEHVVETYVQIQADVVRTWPTLPFFQVPRGEDDEVGHEVRDHDPALARILWVYSQLNPGVGYVQGMNEIAATLYYVVVTHLDGNDHGGEEEGSWRVDPDSEACRRGEAIAFWMLTNLMAERKEMFVSQLDYSDSGVMAGMKELETQLAWYDFEVLEHLRKERIDPRYYAFRWVTLLLSHEFPFATVLRLWDALLCDGSRWAFLTHFCVAMLIAARGLLLASSFGDILKILQSYPLDQVAPFDSLFDLACSLANRTFRSLHTYDKVVEGPLDRQMGAIEWTPFWAVLALSPDKTRANVFLYTDRNKTQISESVDLAGATIECLTSRERNTSKGARQAFRISTSRGNLYLGTFDHLSPRLKWMASFAYVLDVIRNDADNADAGASFSIHDWDAEYDIRPPSPPSDPFSPMADLDTVSYDIDHTLWVFQSRAWPHRQPHRQPPTTLLADPDPHTDPEPHSDPDPEPHTEPDNE